MSGGRSPVRITGARKCRLALILLAAVTGLGWTAGTTRHVAWTAVDFFPSDLARQIRRHHKRFDAGIRRGLAAPPAWRAAEPGKLEQALLAQANHCYQGLKRPMALEDLVEEMGVLAVHVLDANDPLAVAHSDPREPEYSQAYQRYVDTILYLNRRRNAVLRGPFRGLRGNGFLVLARRA